MKSVGRPGSRGGGEEGSVERTVRGESADEPARRSRGRRWYTCERRAVPPRSEDGINSTI